MGNKNRGIKGRSRLIKRTGERERESIRGREQVNNSKKRKQKFGKKEKEMPVKEAYCGKK